VRKTTRLAPPNRWRMAHASVPHVGIGRPILLACRRARKVHRVEHEKCPLTTPERMQDLVCDWDTIRRHSSWFEVAFAPQEEVSGSAE
jgi:hypothetical protein